MDDDKVVLFSSAAGIPAGAPFIAAYWHDGKMFWRADGVTKERMAYFAAMMLHESVTD